MTTYRLPTPLATWQPWWQRSLGAIAALLRSLKLRRHHGALTRADLRELCGMSEWIQRDIGAPESVIACSRAVRERDLMILRS